MNRQLVEPDLAHETRLQLVLGPEVDNGKRKPGSGSFVLAVVQGLAMGVVFWIAGVPYVTLLTLKSMVVSIIPIAGISWVAWTVGIILVLGRGQEPSSSNPSGT